jgi:exopolysaccharide biosynthesis polyprenyl glycosylphosphotransferase
VNETRRRFFLSAYKIFNLSLLVFSFGVATILVGPHTGNVSLTEFLSMRVRISNFVLFAGMLCSWHLIFSICGLYQSKRLVARRSEAIDSLKAVTLITVCLLAFASLFRIRFVHTSFICLFWVFSSASLIAGRIVLRYALGMIRLHGRNLRFMLIMGTNSRAIAFARKIEARPELGYRVLGFVDDDLNGRSEFQGLGYEVHCNLEGLSEYLRHNVVDEVAIYLPLRSFYEDAFRVATLCEQHGIIVHFDSDIFDLKIARTRTEILNGDPHIAAYTGALDGWPALVKRILDLSVSLFLLLLLAPLFLAVAVFVRLTSEGPIFFQQERVGINKRRFLIYKFRTMVANAEKMLAELKDLNEVSGPVFKIKNDPRITPIGKLLRRASIDELPQLLNVLKGDMSLVGPRPLPVRDYEGFNEDWQRRRFSIRPGITCLWQVHGRSSLTFDKWMELDMQYMDEWSLWLDLKILARTIPAVLKGSGAA